MNIFQRIVIGSLLIAAAIVIPYTAVTSVAQKPNRVSTITIDSLGTTGAHVYYQLLDAEGGSLATYSNGSLVRKVPAIVSFDPHGTRGADGRLIYSITVFRPAFLGGAFDKDSVSFDSGRNPGTIDTQLVKAIFTDSARAQRRSRVRFPVADRGLV